MPVISPPAPETGVTASCPLIMLVVSGLELAPEGEELSIRDNSSQCRRTPCLSPSNPGCRAQPSAEKQPFQSEQMQRAFCFLPPPRRLGDI